MKKLTIIKLGGSLINNKTKPYTAKNKIIDRLSSEIKSALDQNPNLQLLIGNGAGSFGHYPAHLYGLPGKISSLQKKYGVCITADGVARLNRIVVRALLKNNVQAVTMQPSAFIAPQEKEVFVKPLLNLINNRFIPVVYGDIFVEKESFSTILSTEKIFSSLIPFLKEKKYQLSIIHVTIVNGVLDKKLKTVPQITQKNYETVKDSFFSPLGYDVTGGMQHKVTESLALAKIGIKSIIINGQKRGNLTKALLNKPVIGTIIS